MASTSSYPAALDAFTNPLSSDPMNSASVAHATLHAHLADAVESMQQTIGKNPQGGYATMGARLDDASYQGHKHAITDVTGLQDALNGKANTVHTHQATDIVSITGTGTLKDDLNVRPTLSSAAGAALASTGSAGTSTQAAHADHVHPFPKLTDLGAASSTTSITPGSGLTGGGPLSANVTLSANFTDGSQSDMGTATTVARGDHIHDSRYFTQDTCDIRYAAVNHNHDGVYVKIIPQPATTTTLPSTTGWPTGTILAVYNP